MDYKKLYKDTITKLQEMVNSGKITVEVARGICADFVPESEDEKIMGAFRDFAENYLFWGKSGLTKEKALAWLEKQCTPAKLNEEEQNRFAKGVLTSCALSFIDYLDAHKYEGKMCVSNGECEDIENAFHNAMWDRLHRYYCKYIEKQGEQKPAEVRTTGYWNVQEVEQNLADKVEPKFKVGDWITNGIDFTFQIHSIEDNMYLRSDDYFIDIETADKNFRLWTIQDAKDGDVLYCEGNGIEYIVMNKGINEYGNIDSYFRYNSLRGFGVDIPSIFSARQDVITPATKEQRDLLFEKMKEAGYEWDAEKKELKKIEQTTAWSEEDIKMIDMIEESIHGERYNYYKKPIEEMSSWLKSLKDRVKPQPKQEWSEEDEDKINRIVACLENLNVADNDILLKDVAWLKSLKDRYAWKPSDLPHWKKSTLPNDNTTGFNSDYFCYKGYNINYKELFEKLPKDD